MPTRDRKHILETLSREAFSSLISGPLGWVVREVAIDYGVDLEVEIFDNDGAATGLTFKVQLKGMERPDHLGPFRDVKVDHLQYWRRLDVPVLLVAYDDSSGVIYGRWIHAIDVELKPQQKSVRIRFGEDDAITAGDARLRRTVETVRRLKSGAFGRPYPVRLIGSGADQATHDYFAMVDELGLSNFIRLDRSDFSFTVSITSEHLRVALPGDVGSFSLTIEPAGSPPELARDSLVVLASLLARINRFGEAMQMARRLVGHSRAIASPEVALELATAAYEIGDHTCAIGLAIDSLDAQAYSAAQIYLLVLRQMPGDDWLSDCRAQLEPSIERCVGSAVANGQPGRAAFWAYNYAQFLYGKNARTDARHWIERALELDPSGYGSRPEPRRLLGGIAWFAGDMVESVDAYQAAVDLGGLEAAGSQLADSLMHAGRYAEAREAISQVLAAGSTNWRDWFVDAVLDELVEHLGLDRQDRRAFPPEGTVLSGLPVEQLETYLVEGDGLNSAVWLARGLEHRCERLTTLMASAFLSNHPVLIAAAVHGMLHYWSELSELSQNTMVRLMHERPDVKEVLLSEAAPVCDQLERDLISEIALRSLELPPTAPGVQLVDESNIPLDPPA